MRKIWCLGTKLVQWRIRGGGFKNLERGGSATGTRSTAEVFGVLLQPKYLGYCYRRRVRML